MLNLWGIWGIFKSDFLKIRSNDFRYFSVCHRAILRLYHGLYRLQMKTSRLERCARKVGVFHIFWHVKCIGLKTWFFLCHLLAKLCKCVFAFSICCSPEHSLSIRLFCYAVKAVVFAQVGKNQRPAKSGPSGTYSNVGSSNLTLAFKVFP